MKKYLLLFILLLPSYTIAAPSQLLSMRASQDRQFTRVVFDIKGPVSYHSFLLNNPNRLVIDFNNIIWRVKKTPSIPTLIKKIRHQKKSHNRIRVVLDLNTKIKLNKFILKNKNTNRLVFDLTDVNKRKFINNKNIKNKIIVKQTKITPPKTIKKRDIIIVIDPGHGGKDPGAIAKNGLREKTVVLAIAKQLQYLINQQPGMKAVLTRKGDYYLPLRSRLRLSRKYNADMFISIHADAFIHSRAKGASVFALSTRGATSEAARWLAQKENFSELGDLYLGNTDPILRSFLIDLSQSASISTSLKMGKMILNELDGFAELHKDHVEQAGFVVLKSPDTPSLLVETGFLSNPTEARRLRSKAYQHKIALAVLKGIRKYFYANPTPGTLIAYRKNYLKKGTS